MALKRIILLTMQRQLRLFRRDVSFSSFIAGLVAVVISYAGPLVIVFQAAKLSGLSTQMTSSWIWAISIGSGLTGLILSWRLKVPVITAWSTPGAALLIGLLPNMPYQQAIGTYLVGTVLTTLIGFSGAFDRVMERMPKGLAAGLLAGMLLRFGMEVFTSITINPILVLVMVGAFLAIRRASPRYAIAGVLLIGIVGAMLADKTHISEVTLDLVTPIFIMPEWSWGAILNMGLPLALVSLTGQFVPGMAVMRASGYKVRAKEIITTTGLASFLLAPFGSHGVNLAAITASICTGKEANEDPAKRYVAGIFCGLIYILIGLFGGAIALLFSALPKELIATLAGLALIGAITSGIIGMVADESHRDASIITFLATASGMNFLGMSSVFWGLVIACLAYIILYKSWSIEKNSLRGQNERRI